MHNEVKRKMIETVARNAAPKSHERLSRAEKFAYHHNLFSDCSCIALYVIACRKNASLYRTAVTRRCDWRLRNFARHSAIYN